MTILQFGAFKGRDLIDVPTGYLDRLVGRLEQNMERAREEHNRAKYILAATLRDRILKHLEGCRDWHDIDEPYPQYDHLRDFNPTDARKR